MTSPLLSNAWYRVASLKPRLRSHARLHRHRYRNQVWYLLQDPVSNRVHRFTPAARLVIAAMDGKRTVENLWELANKRLGEDAPTQDEIIHLLGQLHAVDLLQSDVTPDVSEAFDRGEREAKAQRRRTYMNPMAIRIPLWDPDAILNKLPKLIQLLWGRWGALLWLVAVLPVLVLLPPQWGALTQNFSDRVLAVDNLLMLWLVFPLIKALHELGHATATKAGGGEVHDMGVILLVLIPVPYVEASAASVFRSKYERAVVGAAGMIVELFIAALAFYVWLLIEPGMLRSVMFNVMLIAGISTLAFNGNPLLRYDAYFILADLIEIPNLANRSMRYLQYLINRYVFGNSDAEKPDATRSEKAWFLFYGPASAVYRVFVTIAIALFIGSQFFIVGVILAIWAVVAMAVVPLFKGIKYLLDSPALRVQRQRAISITLGFVAFLFVLLFLIPMPFRSNVEGVVWFTDESIVRAGANGFVSELLVTPGSRVKKGDLLIRSNEPALEAQVSLGMARVAELEASYSAEFVVDKAKANILLEQMQSEKAVLVRLHERADGLLVRAGTDGVFISPHADSMPGRYFRKGDLLGYVVVRGQPLARVVVAQEAVDIVRLANERVMVRHAHNTDIVTGGRVVNLAPAGVEYLPSRALSKEGGGQIQTDPRDQKGARVMQRMFVFDIQLDDSTDPVFFGERVHVRFIHRMEPLAHQWYRSIRLLFLSHFNV